MSGESYLISCPCGREAAVHPGAAGAAIECPFCHAPLNVPRLSQLRQRPSIAGINDDLAWHQFRLATIFAWTTVVAAYLALAPRLLGFPLAAFVTFIGAFTVVHYYVDAWLESTLSQNTFRRWSRIVAVWGWLLHVICAMLLLFVLAGMYFAASRALSAP